MMRTRLDAPGLLGLLGLLGSQGGCFVDPGNASAGAVSAGGSTEAATTTTTGPATGTGSGPGPTTSGTSTGGAESTSGPASTGSSTGGAAGSTGGAAESTGDTSGGATSTGGVELPVPGCVPLFFTDFSDDPSAALELVGSWTWNAKAGTVTVATKDGETSLARTKDSWADAIVHARVRVTSGYGVVRARHVKGLLQPSNYFGSMQPSAHKLQIGRVVNGQSTVFNNPTFPTDAGSWYTMTLEVVGNVLSFGLDDQVLTAAKDGQLVEGQAAIGGYGAGVAEFDWFLVCAAD